ncbi:MAG: hypothetical protein AAGE18_03100 [Pseudomonadota bacterium]
MTVYLHIGSPKCGSTTIQSLLAANRAPLGEAGLHLHPDENFAHEVGHQFVRGWLSDAQRRDRTDEIRALSDEGMGDIVLSSETYMAIGAKRETLDTFLSLFGRREIRVLAVMRSPAALLESTWFQWMRTYRRFDKVRQTVAQAGFSFPRYLETGWFERIDRNWQTWAHHPRIARFTPILMDQGGRLDFARILDDFLDRRAMRLPAETAENESMNGVTFRLLKQYRQAPLESYESFVSQLDRRMSSLGYGRYRLFIDGVRARIHTHCRDLPLFAPFADSVPSYPSAAALPEETFEELLEISRELARTFAPKAPQAAEGSRTA